VGRKVPEVEGGNGEGRIALKGTGRGRATTIS